jgi:hypothetical protein
MAIKRNDECDNSGTKLINFKMIKLTEKESIMPNHEKLID